MEPKTQTIFQVYNITELNIEILFINLQSQLEERDRLVRVLQQQMLRMSENHEPKTDDTCNRATQTDRVINNFISSQLPLNTDKLEFKNVFFSVIVKRCAQPSSGGLWPKNLL